MTEPVSFACGVFECKSEVAVVEEDEKWTVVECADHEARTRHETNPRTVEPLKLMKTGWKSYGTGVR